MSAGAGELSPIMAGVRRLTATSAIPSGATANAEPSMRVAVLATLDAPLLGYLLRELVERSVPIAAVVCDVKGQNPRDHRIHEERTGGRLPPLALDELEAQAIPFYFVGDHRSAVMVDLVRQLEIGLLVNGGTPRILPHAVLEAPRIGVVNCHPGLLPGFRGCTCVEWAIYLDEPVGNTVHFMNERIDEGPIVLQEPVELVKGDTYQDVRVKVYDHGNRLLARGVRRIIDERLTPASVAPQPVGRYFGVIEDDKMATVHRKLTRGEYAHLR